MPQMMGNDGFFLKNSDPKSYISLLRLTLEMGNDRDFLKSLDPLYYAYLGNFELLLSGSILSILHNSTKKILNISSPGKKLVI